MKKTFKIGEYVIGGIIEVIADENIITINFRNMYSDDREIVVDETFAINNPSIIRDMSNFLEDNGTAYYADKVVNFIKTKIQLPKETNTFGW